MTTLREFGFNKECDYFEKLSWESEELKRRIEEEQSDLYFKYKQQKLK